MVLGSILNWVVGRSLDLTVNTISWITQKTIYGIYCAGYYLIKKKENQINDIDKNDFQIIFFTKKELDILFNQNELLKKEIDLLKKIENININELLLLTNEIEIENKIENEIENEIEIENKIEN